LPIILDYLTIFATAPLIDSNLTGGQASCQMPSHLMSELDKFSAFRQLTMEV